MELLKEREMNLKKGEFLAFGVYAAGFVI